MSSNRPLSSPLGFFTRLHIGTRITGYYLMLIVLLAVAVATSHLAVTSTNAVHTRTMRYQAGIADLRALQTALNTQYQDIVALALHADPQAEAAFRRHGSDATVWQEAAGAALDTAEERTSFAQLEERIVEFNTLFFQEIVPAQAAGDAESLRTLDVQAAQLLGEIEGPLNQIVAAQESKLLQSQQEGVARQYTIMAVIISVSVLAVVLGLVAGILLSRNISRPVQAVARAAANLARGDLQQELHTTMGAEIGEMLASFQQMVAYQQAMAGAADRIAQGDLTVAVTPVSDQDVLGHAFQQMVRNLRAMVARVAESASAVRAASVEMAAAAGQSGQATAQVAATIQQVAQGAAQQTVSVTRTASAVDQMGRAIDSVARGAQEQAAAATRVVAATNQIAEAIARVSANAQAGAQGATQSAQTARAGAHTIEEMIGGIEGIRDKVGLSVHKVREMGQRSEEIGAIVEAIDNIASQTNLLALNAAIEAARAGAHGLGFAVVADEVRKLAEKSAAATKEIAALVKGIQRTVAEAVEAMNEGAREVSMGVGRANEAGQSLAQILQATEEVNRQMAEIAASARQMDEQASSLATSMDEMSAVVEENSAATEEMAANSGEVVQAMESIAGVSEESSASAEEVSASVEEVNAQVEEFVAAAQTLSDMAQNLQELVGQFSLPA